MSTEQRRARLAHRHRLTAPEHTDSVPAIADALVALHSSDPATVYLSATARMHSPSIAAVGTALHDDRSIVRHHAMRRTIWVCTPEVMRAAHAACTIGIATVEWKKFAKWVADSGIADADGWVQRARADTLAALHRLGPTTARALGKAVPALTTRMLMGGGKYAAPQAAHTRLLLLLGFDGELVRTVTAGSWVSSEYEWSVTADWLSQPITGADPVAARTDLAGRYLRQFGPVTTADLQWWAGWTAGATKAALAANDAVEVQLDDGSTAWCLPDDLAPVDLPERWVALLPGLDPTAMGWKERSWCFGPHTTFGGPLFDRNGNVGPTVWVDGRVVGAWAQRKDGTVVHELVHPVDPGARTAIDAMAEQLRATIGEARVTPRFPAPLQQSLAAG